MNSKEKWTEEVVGVISLDQNPSLKSRVEKPLFKYSDTTENTYIGKDVFGREITGTYDDRYISTIDGRFVPLEVQCADEVLRGSGGSTWTRRSIRNIGPWTLRLANWTIAGWPKRIQIKTAFKSPKIIGRFAWRFLVTWLPLMFLSMFFLLFAGETINGARYSPVPYRYYGRAKKSRNTKDDVCAKSLVAYQPMHSPQFQSDLSNISKQIAGSGQPTVSKERIERTLLPRKLCFLDSAPTSHVDPETGEKYLEYHATNIEKWMIENKRHCPEYLFVAFAGKHFSRDLSGMRPKEAQRLHELARYATQAAGLDCYWICLNCIADESEGMSRMVLDVWRISDVIRGCKELTVLVRHPRKNETVADALGEWAGSIWTIPELLISPGDKISAYYYAGIEAQSCLTESMPKNQFASRCLSNDQDRYHVRRLIDHYLGNLRLSDLELTTIALHCFSTRINNDQFLSGDYSYALMGLLGRRPLISPTDSAYLAFARLSLENYNDQLFERFICLLPAERSQPWHEMKDAYGAQLWDIEPSVQVAGIGVYKPNQIDEDDAMFECEFFLPHNNDEQSYRTRHKNISLESHPTVLTESAPLLPGHSELVDDDVVILDGCFAATVHWDRFQPVSFTRRLTWGRLFSEWVVRLNTILFIIGIVLAAVAETYRMKETLVVNKETGRLEFVKVRGGGLGGRWDLYCFLAVVFLLYSISVFILAPWIIRRAYGGKVWETQPWFFGFEGYMPIEEIEKRLFGANLGRLAWSHYASSPLSHHAIKDCRWVEPRDPCENPDVRVLVERAKHAEPGDSRVFTIVDTYSMTVTLFEANRPPEVLLICGSEGGMQRALGCSFEWTTSTFYRETVLRLETRVLERMDRIRRVRLGIKRKEKLTARIATMQV